MKIIRRTSHRHRHREISIFASQNLHEVEVVAPNFEKFTGHLFLDSGLEKENILLNVRYYKRIPPTMQSLQRCGQDCGSFNWRFFSRLIRRTLRRSGRFEILSYKRLGGNYCLVLREVIRDRFWLFGGAEVDLSEM